VNDHVIANQLDITRLKVHIVVKLRVWERSKNEAIKEAVRKEGEKEG
jgi:hypothetical protein